MKLNVDILIKTTVGISGCLGETLNMIDQPYVVVHVHVLKIA